MENRKILITGGAGSIGSELVRQLAPKNDVFIFDSNETAFFDLHEELNQQGIKVWGKVGDVRDLESLKSIEERWGLPELIFNAAALKHVTPSAWSPREYVDTNIIGTLNVLRLAGKTARVINVSTDKVINANSIMGATKKVAEIAVKDAGHISVRFGNVMGSRGSVLPIWQRQLDQGKPLTVTDERMTRYMMTIPQACSLIIKAAEVGEPGQILILDMGDPINILELAKEILHKSGKPEDIRMIGMRPGETLDEKLMTDDEQETAQRLEDFWILHAKTS